MTHSTILRAAMVVIASAWLQAAPMPVAAEEFTIPGDEVAETLEQLFSNTQVRLHSAGASAGSFTGRRSFYDPNGSFIRFGGQLSSRRHPILTEESGLRVLLDPSDNGGGEYLFFANLNDVNSTRVDVQALDDGFRMTFTLEPNDPEVMINCVHLRRGSTRFCPATASAGSGPQVNWNQPAEWSANRLRITLKPILHAGSVALRVSDVELIGEVDPPDAMGCSSANTVPGALCFIVDNFIDNLQDKVLGNERFPHPAAAMSLEKTFRLAFDDAQIKNFTALNMVPELTRANVQGKICAVRMQNGNLVVEGKRRPVPAGEQVPTPPNLIDGGTQDFDPGSGGVPITTPGGP